MTPAIFGLPDPQSQGVETARRHAREKHEKDLLTVQQMELKMGIATHWVPDSFFFFFGVEGSGGKGVEASVPTVPRQP